MRNVPFDKVTKVLARSEHERLPMASMHDLTTNRAAELLDHTALSEGARTDGGELR